MFYVDSHGSRCSQDVYNHESTEYNINYGLSYGETYNISIHAYITYPQCSRLYGEPSTEVTVTIAETGVYSTYEITQLWYCNV